MYYHNSNRPFVEKGTLVIFPKRKKKRKEVPSRHNRDTKNMLIFRMAKPVLYRIVHCCLKSFAPWLASQVLQPSCPLFVVV